MMAQHGVSGVKEEQICVNENFTIVEQSDGQQ